MKYSPEEKELLTEIDKIKVEEIILQRRKGIAEHKEKDIAAQLKNVQIELKNTQKKLESAERLSELIKKLFNVQ